MILPEPSRLVQHSRPAMSFERTEDRGYCRKESL